MFPRALTLSAWALLAACEGPTLDVGDLRVVEFDAGSDGAEDDAWTEEDAAEPEMEPRDAQTRDGRAGFEFTRCSSDEECTKHIPRCLPQSLFPISICVECFKSEHCRFGEYCETNWLLRCVPLGDRNDHPPGEPGP